MTVTLKNVAIRDSISAEDPFGDTIEVLWEVVGDFPWTDLDGRHSKVINTIKPVVVEKSYVPQYTRIEHKGIT